MRQGERIFLRRCHACMADWHEEAAAAIVHVLFDSTSLIS